MPRLRDPDAAPLPRNRREFAVALLRCRARTMRQCAIIMVGRETQEAREVLKSLIRDTEAEAAKLASRGLDEAESVIELAVGR